MKILILLFALLFSLSANADNYLCIGESGAAITDNMAGEISSKIYEFDSIKLIFSNDSGKWSLKEVSSKMPLPLNLCTEYGCAATKGHAGFFSRSARNDVFTYTKTVYHTDDKEMILLAMKGKCSKL